VAKVGATGPPIKNLKEVPSFVARPQPGLHFIERHSGSGRIAHRGQAGCHQGFILLAQRQVVQFQRAPDEQLPLFNRQPRQLVENFIKAHVLILNLKTNFAKDNLPPKLVGLCCRAAVFFFCDRRAGQRPAPS
jgi:hypothetical protein